MTVWNTIFIKSCPNGKNVFDKNIAKLIIFISYNIIFNYISSHDVILYNFRRFKNAFFNKL